MLQITAHNTSRLYNEVRIELYVDSLYFPQHGFNILISFILYIQQAATKYWSIEQSFPDIWGCKIRLINVMLIGFDRKDENRYVNVSFFTYTQLAKATKCTWQKSCIDFHLNIRTFDTTINTRMNAPATKPALQFNLYMRYSFS